MLHNFKQVNKTVVFVFFALTAALLSVVFYNGYPLMTPDSGSYIRHAFDFQLPADRSPFYGVFIGITSLRHSLWPTIIIQAALLSFLLIQYATFIGVRFNALTGIFFIILITIGTQAAWVTGFLMPDIFTAILFIACTFFLLNASLPKLQYVFYLLIIAVSVSIHNSHYPIIFIFSAILFVIAIIRKNQVLIKRSLAVFITCGFVFLLVSTAYYKKGLGFTISPGGHVFLMGKLAETGILSQYLNEPDVATKNYRLLPYKNYHPDMAYDFVWNEQSPLYKTGGWDNSKKEYSAIIKDILSRPKYLKRFAIESAKSTGRQLCEIKMADMISGTGSESAVNKYIQEDLPNEYLQYKSSKQETENIHIKVWNRAHLLFLLLTSIWCLLIINGLPDKKRLINIYLLLFLFICINAFVTGAFANVLDRLQYRVSWLFPATNVLTLLHYYSHPKAKNILSQRSI